MRFDGKMTRMFPNSSRPTMRDVARASGVAIKTVSRVMNGEPNVASATAERVLRAADEMGYVMHQQASDLRRRDGGVGAIGLLLSSVGNAFDSHLHRAVERVANDHGMMTLAASTEDDPDVELARLRGFVARRLDGLIVLTVREDHSLLARELERGWPVVFADRPAPGVDCDSVTSDNAGGVRAAVQHVRGYGHTRIAFLSNLQVISTSRERTACFREATRDLPDCTVTTDLGDEAAVIAAIERLMGSDAPPTAILSGRNDITIATVRALQRLGLERSVALVGFDDIPLADLVRPGITVIAQDPDALGELAATRLIARVRGESLSPEQVVVPTRLIVRGSGEITAGRS
ncbi:LacI family transcriptional regulator [Tessaracoccus sp. ZS01]|nr:LacI family transcriptional regulator [Tessaracoccus sp. ZS01]